MQLITHAPPDDHTAVLEIKGRFDAYVVSIFEARLNHLLENGFSNVLLNLKEVDFIDSTALAIMVHWVQRYQNQNGKLALFGLQTQVKQLFEMTHLDKVFAIHPDDKSAFKHISLPVN